jgi:hypothetical protein
MAYHASPSSAPSAHPHVSYTSYPHSKDVNNSIGACSEVGDHSEANLEVRVTAFETEMKEFKTGMTGLKTEVKDRGTEMKDIKTGMMCLETQVKELKTDMKDFKTKSSTKSMSLESNSRAARKNGTL